MYTLLNVTNIYDLGFFSAKPNQFFRKIINIESLGNAVINEKDISFQKKPEARRKDLKKKSSDKCL
jgi:hypothetical protein